MERLVRIDQKTIKRYSPDNFALQRIFKELCVGYEYLVEGAWTAGPPSQKPDGKRILFGDVERFRVARDVYFAWQNLSRLKVDNPVKPEVIINRLLAARLIVNPLRLFIPWGVRPEGEPRLERVVLERIALIETQLKERGIDAQTLIMPADLYATEVNRQVSEGRTAEYFTYIAELAKNQGFLVKPWSEIREENWEAYTNRASLLTEGAIRQLLPNNVIEETLLAAKRRSGYSVNDLVRQSAFAYLRERVCEAEIVEAIYQPIKVSAVSKNKDNFVDRDLPRLYTIPRELQFPWLT